MQAQERTRTAGSMGAMGHGVLLYEVKRAFLGMAKYVFSGIYAKRCHAVKWKKVIASIHSDYQGR